MKKYSNTLPLIFSILLALVMPIENVSAESGAQETNLPTWVKNFKFKGDLRLRYQLDQNTGQEDRSRGRIRARMDISAKVTNDVKISLGFTSGDDNPRSTNHTLGNSFKTPDLRFDYFFAKYEVSENATLYAGKLPRSLILWHLSDMLWDGDIRIEGIGGRFFSGPYFLNLAAAVLGENKSASDTTIAAIQSGAHLHFGEFKINGAVSYYAFSGVKGEVPLAFSSRSNSTVTVPDPADPRETQDVLKFDYDSIISSLEVVTLRPFGSSIPRMSVFGKYGKSLDPSDENTHFLFGIGLGNKKVQDRKEWKLTALFRHLERDSWLDVLPDSDFALGKTGYKGYEVIAQLGLKKNVVLGLDYYDTAEIHGKNKEKIVQIDILMRF